ncbi:Not1-domain-containing protein [Westerdykella ornata]|uniref:General negative regulator of transcription subunit 1 n=1 Tax=Westerdykella ornata TaxID=318751 RepID=A0A6A6JVQ9_WESOR|nr:Not1-domain-containing protein [Westerdykella ornata]KAF2280315.1 Not1-domain-containing protein [Westerdykella ornata]
MSQQHPWGASRHHQSTRLPPISTAIAHDQSNVPSPNASRPPHFSPASSNFPSLPPASIRHVGSRKSSAASSSSPFSPSHPGQQAPPSQLLSSRARTIAPPSASQLASSAAALPTASQGGGASSSSGGGASKLARDSPSLSGPSTLGSPSASNSVSSASNQSLSRIVIAQLFLLLSQFGPLKNDKDRAKWDTQTEQIRKLVDSHGMDVFTKYFRRLVQQNAAQLFPSGGRNVEPNGSYDLLLAEMQKLRTDPKQPAKIAESIDSNDGDLFRDFDLSTFMTHFQLDPIAKMAFALACRSASKSDIRAKADAILANVTEDFLNALKQPFPSAHEQASIDYEIALLERLLMDPPSNWSDMNKQHLVYALQTRFHGQAPTEYESVLFLSELLDGPSNQLVKTVLRAGPRGTANLEAWKDMLASAEVRDISPREVANALLYMAIFQKGQAYNSRAFVAALREHRTGKNLDFQDVVKQFDRERLRITKPQFLSLYNALLPVAVDSTSFDIQALWGGVWKNELTQLSFLICFLSTTPEELDVSQIPRLRPSFTMKIFEDAPDDVKTVAETAVKHPFISLDATSALFGMIFQTEDSYHVAHLLGIPGTIINPHTAEFLVSAVAVPKPWGILQEQALKQVFEPYFTRKLAHYNFVLYGLWQQDPRWLVEQFIEHYNRDPRQLALVFEYARSFGWLETLIRSINDLSLDLAAQAHAVGLFDIEPWLRETFERSGTWFRRVLTNFLHTRASDEMQSLRDDHPALSLPLAVKTVHPLLWFLADCGLPDTELVALQRTCIQAYPRLINYGEGVDDIIDKNGEAGNRLPDEADKKMQEHFKNMYSGESDVRDIINILRKYKESRDPAEQDLFACMIHGLFDEYNCFGEYPLEALATTAVLFGGIINFNLLSRIALQVGLAMVLEAVQEYRPEDSMYKFGLQALLHFANRLPEWPNYCDQLLIVPGLQGTEIYAKAEEVVKQVGELNGEPQNGLSLTNGNTVGDAVQQAEPTVPRFSCLHVDPPLHPDIYEEPEEEIKDRVLFVLNNLSEQNLHEKFKELADAIEAKHHQWFASYLVEERAKVQPNYQDLYLHMLDLFDDKDLWAEVLRETYVSVFRLLNGDGQLNTPDKSNLKNLGDWLGSLTLERDKPILFRNISFKDLLIEGYNTDRLVIVILFTCRVLAKAKNSTVFKYPNPWLVEILRVLAELYADPDLKLQQKFAIEILAQALGLQISSIEPSDAIRTRPLVEEEYMGPLPPDGIEPFSDLAIMSLNRARGSSERFSAAAIADTIPDFSNQLIYPPTGNSNVPAATLKKIFLTAVQQAIQEIIAPVVERSVTIAAISTSQLITKDFAMEPDEEKLRSAAHTVVKSLSGALALVTCKEPLRMSIMNNIRVMARDPNLPEQALPEGHLLMFVNDNLDLVCSIVEQAAEQASLTEIDLQIDDRVRLRRLWRTQRTNEPFKDGIISQWAFFIPEPYRQTAGGLNREQLAIYEEFGRQPRGAPHANNAPQESGRQVPDVLQDQFAPVPNLPNISTPAAASVETRQNVPQGRLPNMQVSQAPGQQLNGFAEPLVPERPQRNIEQILSDMVHMIHEAPEERMSSLNEGSSIQQTFIELVTAVKYSPEVDAISLRLALQVIQYIFSEQLRRLEVEVLTRLLMNLCTMSTQTSRQVLIWLGTMQDDDRFFNPVVMVSLLEIGLMDIHRLNTTIAKAIMQRRVAAVELLSALMDEVLFNDNPSALRADFALSIDALTNWLAEDTDFDSGKQLMSKLQALSAEQPLTPPSTEDNDQLEYVFSEWVHLALPDTPRKLLVAFIHQLHKNHVLETREKSITFLRVCLDVSVASYEQVTLYGAGYPDTATIHVDALAKLIVFLVGYHGEQEGAGRESKVRYFDGILVLIVFVLNHHQKTRGERFSPKAYFRLLSTILHELHEATKQGPMAAIKAELFLAMAKAFLILQPQAFPLFTYQWLTLISHRIFIPVMLDDGPHESGSMVQRWDMYARLIEVLLEYTGRLIRPGEETLVATNFYRGVLRVLLVIHHDFPEFLADYHFRFCNSIPMRSTQVRNLIVSAYPSAVHDMPDPFTAGLKTDRLEDVRALPVIRADVDRMLTEAGMKQHVDDVLRASEPSNEDVERICNATYYAEPKPAGLEQFPTTADPKLIHALVLYICNADLASQSSKTPSFESNSSSAKLFERLAKQFRPEAQFHLVSAIANQLRWPNAHTHYFSHVLLHLFGPPKNEAQALGIQEVIVRVLLERLLVHRPHPWGLIVTLLEILKNRQYGFWDLPFVKAAPEVERLMSALFADARAMAQQSPRPMA